MSLMEDSLSEGLHRYDLPEFFRSYFDDRQIKQIRWSMLYKHPQFNHGTDGHNNMLIIAKLAELCISLDGRNETIIDDTRKFQGEMFARDAQIKDLQSELEQLRLEYEAWKERYGHLLE